MPRFTDGNIALLRNPDAMSRLPKDRRDFLEIFGNQWGPRRFDAARLTPEENTALLDALNPFARKETSCH